MDLTEENIATIKNCGRFGYDVHQTMNILDLRGEDRNLFEMDFNSNDSLIAKYYNEGKDLFEYEIDKALMATAKEGDLLALDRLEERQAIRKAKQDE